MKHLPPFQITVGYKIQILNPETEKNLSKISELSNLPSDAKYENSKCSEISLNLLFCSETVKRSLKTVADYGKSRWVGQFKSFLKLRKIFPTFPSFWICPNAKYENSEISKISLTLLFCSEIIEKSKNTCHHLKSQLDIKFKSWILKLRKIFTRFPSFRIFPQMRKLENTKTRNSRKLA